MIASRRSLRSRAASVCAFSVAALLASWAPSLRSAPEVTEMSVSSATLDEALAGKKTYNFVVISADEIVDTDGRHFAPSGIKSYLKKTKPDKKAAYIFWVPDPKRTDILKPIIERFSNYGATLLVVRDQKKRGSSAVPANTDAKDKKTLMIVGQPNPKASTAGDRAPDMSGRPALLRPGELPRRVRYQYQSDAVVIAAADALTHLLLEPAPATPPAPAKDAALLIWPGAWHHLSPLASLREGKPIRSKVELTSGVITLTGQFVNTPGQVDAAVAEVRRLVSSDGGGTLRALRSDEMDFWWTYIGWDIEEPVFILESKGGAFRFVVDWHNGQLLGIDELHALPAR